ncbi:MAG: LPP20 family lipoprotein [Betaproteobacteria bacterium]|nr:LPP20 family lipoprotein [Betaproteobacteria bacterium]
MLTRRSAKVLALVVVALGLAACASGAGRNVAPAKPVKNYPAWVLNPDQPGLIGVIGSAPRQEMGGRDAQYRVAMIRARQELARMIRVQIQATSTTRVEERNGRATQDFDSEMRMRANEALRLDRARVVDEWVDAETGELYLHLVTPK